MEKGSKVELFLMEHIESICSLKSKLSFGTTRSMKILSRKWDNDDLRTSESETENQNPKTLDDYDEDEMVQSKQSKSKKEEKKSDIGSKLEKIAAGHELTPEKSKSSDKRKKSSRKKSVSKERVYIFITWKNFQRTFVLKL